MDKIIIKGAREHNLKNVDLEIPRGKMIVFTGLSGSGKSSMAYDTIFAEGQRRYIESLSAYARQFLGKLDKPDVDEIEGLSPAISIDQKSHSANPRSTVATITEIYDYLRVLYARLGKPFCPTCGNEIKKMTNEEIVDAVIDFANSRRSDSPYGEAGSPHGEAGLPAGKVSLPRGGADSPRSSSGGAGKNILILAPVVRGRKGEYYQLLYDFLNAGFRETRIDGKMYMLSERIELSRYKAHTIEIVMDRVPSGLDFRQKDNRLRISEAIEHALKHGKDVVTVVSGPEISLSAKFTCPRDGFSFPEIEPRLFSFNSPFGACENCHGLGEVELDWGYEKGEGWQRAGRTCPSCQGRRLKPEALNVLIKNKNISALAAESVADAYKFFETLSVSSSERFREVAEVPLREIKGRLKFLLDVGLEYLTLDRKTGTLSGGEAQRIRLASQIGSRLTGTLYILDEPTIGLHQKDNAKLIKTLHDLRDLGNTIVVVEHDEETILSGDYLVDFGPGAGIHGGKVIASGLMPAIIKDHKKTSLTLEYLRGKRFIEVPKERRKVSRDHDFLKIKGASANNLKNVDIDIPLRRLTCITGVSGSGKSSLVYDVLYRNVSAKLSSFGKIDWQKNIKAILGLEYINRVINIDQSAIGRTPRSNPATYVGAWTFIRELFSMTEDARVRGYKPGRFSFNVPGGRCENCEGHGVIAIEMHFLPTVFVECDVCHGKRFDRETLEVEFKNKNIYDILRMTVEEAVKFFKDIPHLHDRLRILEEVGLGYLTLGQSATTLSGGEAQRVKLSAELGKRDTRKTLYLLDEPTTGLHFADVDNLLKVLNRLVERGNTMVVIEHNLDVIKTADWVIDLGPEGGVSGGEIVAVGTPEAVSRKAGSFTAQYLRKVLK